MCGTFWDVWDACAVWLKRCRGSASKARSDHRGEEWHARQLTLGSKEQRCESVRANARSNQCSGMGARSSLFAIALLPHPLNSKMANPTDWRSLFAVIMAFVLPFPCPDSFVHSCAPLRCPMAMRDLLLPLPSTDAQGCKLVLLMNHSNHDCASSYLPPILRQSFKLALPCTITITVVLPPTCSPILAQSRKLALLAYRSHDNCPFTSDACTKVQT